MTIRSTEPNEAAQHSFVSVIVPAKNKEGVIGRCLESLLRLDYPRGKLQILVVDGRSSDRTAQIASEFGARVVYDSGQGRCRAHGLNAGVRLATGEYIAFTDPDCRVQPDWISRGLRCLRTTGAVGVGGPVLVPSGVQSAVAHSLSFLLRLVAGADSNGAGPVPRIAGCNSIYRAEPVKSAFPLQEVLAGEDALLNLRLRDAGSSLWFDPEQVVWTEPHYSTLSAVFRQMVIYGEGAGECWEMDRRLTSWDRWLKAVSVPVIFLTCVGFLPVSLWVSVSVGGVVFCLSLIPSILFFSKHRSIRKSLVLLIVAYVAALGYSVGFFTWLGKWMMKWRSRRTVGKRGSI